jgi:hypothetical protein
MFIAPLQSEGALSGAPSIVNISLLRSDNDLSNSIYKHFAPLEQKIYSLNLNPTTSILMFARASLSLIPSSITGTSIVLFGGNSE